MMKDDFNLEKGNFAFLDGDVPRSPSYGVLVLLEFVVMLVNQF